MFYRSAYIVKERHADGQVFHQSFRGAALEGVAPLRGWPDASVVETTPYTDWTLLHFGPDYQYLPFRSERPQAADFDGDGRDELVLDGHTGVAILPVDPAGTHLACYLPVPASVAGLWAVGDLDGDGRAAFISADGGDLLYESLPPDGVLGPR